MVYVFKINDHLKKIKTIEFMHISTCHRTKATRAHWYNTYIAFRVGSDKKIKFDATSHTELTNAMVSSIDPDGGSLFFPNLGYAFELSHSIICNLVATRHDTRAAPERCNEYSVFCQYTLPNAIVLPGGCNWSGFVPC
jgi:hypothetical protein